MTSQSSKNGNNLWLKVSSEVGNMSRCIRRQVGAVILDSGGRVCATGYNGPPASYQPVHSADNQCNQRTTCEKWCERAQAGESDQDRAQPYWNCVAIHAEANALLFVDRDAIAGGMMLITSFPCRDCAKLIANSGLKEVHFYWDTVGDAHRTLEVSDTIQFLKSSGLAVYPHQAAAIDQ